MDNYYGNQGAGKPANEQAGVKGNDQWAQRQAMGDIMNLTLTTDERRILEECQAQASIRGFTLSAFTTAGCYIFMKKGIIQRSKFIIGLSGVAGFLIGAMSYRSACLEKLMALPNSTLKERILAAQGLQPQVRVDLQPQDGQSQSWYDSVLPNNSYSSEPMAPMGSAIDLEPYQSPDYDSLSRNAIDHDAGFALNPPLPSAGSSFTTYDDLRRKNREEYDNRMRTYQQPQQPAGAPFQSTDPRSSTFDRAFDPSPPPSSDNYWR